MLEVVLNAAGRFGTDINLSCQIASAAGLVSHHLYFIRGFREMNTRNIIGGHLLALSLLLFKTTSTLGISRGFFTYAVISSAYFASLFSSIFVYRVFFHPLRHFPGPLGLRFTQMYMPWLARDGKLHQKYVEFHEQYGDFVRVGPNNLSITHIDAIAVVHGPKTACTKKNTTIYDSFHVNGERNLDSILDDKVHRDRRAIWDKSLNMDALKRYEKHTRRVLHDWLDRLAMLDGSPINTSRYAKLIGFDNMGHIGFSTDFGTVREGREDRMLDLLEISFSNVAKMGQLSWPQALLMSLPKFGMQKEFEQLAVDISDQRIKRQGEDLNDMYKVMIDDLRAEKPRSMSNINTMYADTQGILIGATDTIACTLGLLFYFLARDADLRQRLYEAILPLYGKTEPGEFTVADLNEVDLFEGVLNESMRLKAPAPLNGIRLTPPEGITVGDTYVPGGIRVITPPQVFHTSPRYFKQSLEFIPERWTTRPDLIIDKRAFFPFHFGRKDCVGKRLAKNVLRMTIAYTLYNYDFEFAPGEDGSAFERDERWQLILKPGSLNCVFTKREHA